MPLNSGSSSIPAGSRPVSTVGRNTSGSSRGLARAAQDRHHRSALSTPCRPGRADRGRRRSSEGSDPGRQGQALRPFRGWSANDPSRACRSAGYRRRERILTLVEKARRRSAADAARNSGSASFHSALWARASLRERSTRIRRSTVPTSAILFPASRRRPERRIGLWSTCLPKSLKRRMRHLLRSHSLGFLPRSRGSFPSRARQSSRAWKRTSEQPQSNLRPTISARSTAPPQRLG